MKALYDSQIFSVQELGGISRYFVEVMHYFEKTGTVDFELPITYTNNEYIGKLKSISSKPFFPGKDFKGKKFLMEQLNRFPARNRMKASDYNLFHPTYYHPYFLKYIGNKPFVLTIHDMIHELYPEAIKYRAIDSTAQHKKLLAQKAAKIIAISKHTKNDILRFYNLPEKKIEVIYHGNSLLKSPPDYLPKVNLPAKYLLYVGKRGGYKNFNRMLRAIAPLLVEHPDLHLICAGGGPFSTSEKQFMSSLKVAQKCVKFPVDDALLSYLYEHAEVFIYPSIYEGFGIPILEAFDNGCPVAVSRTSCFPEIAETGAVYFNPFSEQDMRETVKLLIGDSEIKNTLKNEGSRLIQKFSWKQTAEQTKALYESI